MKICLDNFVVCEGRCSLLNTHVYYQTTYSSTKHTAYTKRSTVSSHSLIEYCWFMNWNDVILFFLAHLVWFSHALAKLYCLLCSYLTNVYWRMPFMFQFCIFSSPTSNGFILSFLHCSFASTVVQLIEVRQATAMIQTTRAVTRL